MNELKAIEILLIEDNKADADLIVYTLKRNRMKNLLRIIYDGEDALRYLLGTPPYTSEQLPDLILLDINLPRVNGLEVLKTIQKYEHTRQIPVIVLTTSTDANDEVLSLRNNAIAFLNKPMDFGKFTAALTKLDNYWIQIVRSV